MEYSERHFEYHPGPSNENSLYTSLYLSNGIDTLIFFRGIVSEKFLGVFPIIIIFQLNYKKKQQIMEQVHPFFRNDYGVFEIDYGGGTHHFFGEFVIT